MHTKHHTGDASDDAEEYENVEQSDLVKVVRLPDSASSSSHVQPGARQLSADFSDLSNTHLPLFTFSNNKNARK